MVCQKKEQEDKVTVNIQYPCYICANQYVGARQVINHVENMHGYILNPRQIGYHRPPSKYFDYENDVKKKWNVQHFGCPSCWFHCPKNFESLMKHIMEEHNPVKVEGFIPKHEDDDIEEYEEETDELEEDSDEDDQGTGCGEKKTSSDDDAVAATTNRSHRSASVASSANKKEGISHVAVSKDPIVAKTPSSGGDVSTTTVSSVGNDDTSFNDAERQEGKGQIAMAEEIRNKLNDLNIMIKQLFN